MKTPFFTYSLGLLNETLKAVNSASINRGFKVHYAVKANFNPQILGLIQRQGLGADCVSGGEIQWALEAGFKAKDIVFAGVGKTDEEIEYAISNGIGMIHCEGLQEICSVNAIAKKHHKKIEVALRLNPNINANTHAKITTGLSENKFGFSEIEFNKLIDKKHDLCHLNIVGLHFHIGSQIRDMNIFKMLCEKINAYSILFEDQFNDMTYLNVGGGLGINYDSPDSEPIPDFETYFSVFESTLSCKTNNIHFELGRSIVAQCGQLHTKVLYIKESETKTFGIVDAGMTELLRPALYDAYHQISYNGIAFKDDLQPYDIVGPICETSDCLGKAHMLPELKRGDVLVIKSCGAYAESMRLQYNGRGQSHAICYSPEMEIVDSTE
ncbi:MAG: diaminopimelate decarboxylase [Crocinitomicaceae bacterium]